MVSWAARERLGLVTETLSVKFAIRVQAEIESAFSGTVGHFTDWNCGKVLVESDRTARFVHGLDRISANEVGKVLDGIDARVTLLTLHETFKGTNRLRL